MIDKSGFIRWASAVQLWWADRGATDNRVSLEDFVVFSKRRKLALVYISQDC